MIIGINGYARTGKDEIAKILVRDFGFIRAAFADKLRESVYALNPIVDYYEEMIDLNGFSVPTAVPKLLQSVIDEYGWDGVKSTRWGPEVRRLLQRFGTEVGRNLLGENIWVDATFNAMNTEKDYVITDCRFINEAQGIISRGGVMWRVNRPGVGPINNHISEIGLDNFPFNAVVNNDGDLTDLAESVRVLLK